MSGEPFLIPKLVGERFNDAVVPLSFLKDLSFIEELIILAAKNEYLKESGRDRTPRGFTEGFMLALTGLESGSAKLAISLITLASTVIFHTTQPYLIKGRDSVINAISAISRNESPIQYLDDKILRRFDHLGRGLQDDESIEFSVPDSDIYAKLDQETRMKILRISGIKSYTKEISIVGIVPRADQQKKTFGVLLLNGSTIDFPITDIYLNDIIKAFSGYEEGTHVRVDATAQYDMTNKLEQINSIKNIDILDPLDVTARLKELECLEDGWLYEGSIAPSKEGLRWLARSFQKNYPDDLSLPHIYPTPEGNVQMEWGSNRKEASLEVNLADHSAYWHVAYLDSGEFEEEQIDIRTKKCWEFLSVEIKKMEA